MRDGQPDSWEETRRLHHLVAEGSDQPTALMRQPAQLRGPITSVSADQVRLVLGRGASCDVILEDDRISRRHAVIYLEGENAWIEDAGSSNGTYVDGNLVSGRWKLHPGAAIRFGRRGPVFRYGLDLPGAGGPVPQVHYTPPTDIP